MNPSSKWKSRLKGVLLIFPIGIALAPVACAVEAASQTIQIVATIQVPGNPLKSFDISWVDPASHRYYLADRSNSSIDVVNTRDLSFAGQVGGFAGVGKEKGGGGPNGVVAIADKHQVWAGDGNSRVQVIDLASTPPRIVKTIATNGTSRCDELAYDPADKLVMVGNNDDQPAFVSFIATDDYKVLGTIKFPHAKYGVEQSVWIPAVSRFYLAVPVTAYHLALPPIKGVEGEIAEIDPRTMTITRSFPVIGCAGTGLALGPSGDLLQACHRSTVTMVLNPRTGALTTIDRVGGSDEAWFNPGDNHYYVAAGGNDGGPVLGVIDATSNKWIENVETAPGSHSVAADPESNRIFVALAPNQSRFDNDPTRGLKCTSGCIGVYAANVNMGH